MKWTQGRHYENLTIIVVGHNLTSLYYPFIESFMSAIPLGCRFLYGDCQSTDETRSVINHLSQYAPIEIIDIPWQSDKGGQAIGEATQDLIDYAKTQFVFNLQACEILHPDVAEIIEANEELCAMWCRFHHFWGSFKFDGRVDGRAYGEAPRLYNKQYINLRCSDGCWDSTTWSGPMEHSGWKCAGTISRYSYIWDNQVSKKAHSHYRLYHGDAQTPAVRIDSINWCKKNENYDGPHPLVIHHAIGLKNYDLKHSMSVLESMLETI